MLDCFKMAEYNNLIKNKGVLQETAGRLFFFGDNWRVWNSYLNTLKRGGVE